MVRMAIRQEAKFLAHFQGHVILAVRSYLMYEEQQLHGMMRMLGFEGNYQLRMTSEDHVVFKRCLKLYNGTKEGEADARAKREEARQERVRVVEGERRHA